MGIELVLRGSHGETSVEALLARIERWLPARDGEPPPRCERTDAGTLAVELHPAAEAMVLDASPTGLTLEAKTGTAGPGYHRYVCSLARELAAAVGVRWSHARDESRFFDRGDEEALARMSLEWVRGAAIEILARAAEGSSGFLLAMPEGYAYQHDGLVATPLGPRDRAWVEAVAADPSLGEDIFAWWNAARDGRYYRDLARVVMWRDVRWRPPVEEHERALMEGAATWIEKAFALDTALELPWAEQAELLQLLGEVSLRATRAQMRAGRKTSSIGYRRHPVRARLSGGFSLEIPGEMAEKWDERGTWVGWDAQRTIWFTSLHVEVPPGAPEPTTQETLAGLPKLESDDALELESGEIAGLAAFVDVEEGGAVVHRLDAHAAIGADAAVGTIVFSNPEDRRWALEVWGSLEHRQR